MLIATLARVNRIVAAQEDEYVMVARLHISPSVEHWMLNFTCFSARAASDASITRAIKSLSRSAGGWARGTIASRAAVSVPTAPDRLPTCHDCGRPVQTASP